MNYKTFEGALFKMSVYFGKEIRPEVMAIYWDAMKNMDEGKFKNAAVRIMADFEPTSAKPFPLIKDFLTCCGEDGKSRAINVISALKKAAELLGQYPSVDFRDPALHATIERYGGWTEVVLWNEQDWQYHERNFIAAYEAARNACVKGPAYLVGALEKENSKNGFMVEAPTVVSSITGEVVFLPPKREGVKIKNQVQSSGGIKNISHQIKDVLNGLQYTGTTATDEF